MGAASNLYVNLITRYAPFVSGMNKSKRSLRSFTAQIGRTQKRLLQLAVGTVGIYAIIRATKRVVREYATFEEQMAMVSTMLNKQAMQYLPKYTKALQRMAVEFGESTDTLAKGLYDILSASVAPAKALDVLTISVMAAKAGFTSTAIAADTITTVMNSYGYAAEQAGYVSDILFTIIKRGKTTFAELGPNIGKVAALAASSNISLAELGAVLATLTRSIGQTDIAITGMRGVLRAFLKPSKEAIPVARSLGIELSTTALKAEGLYSILDKLSKATPAQVAQIAGRMQGMLGFIVALRELTKSHEDYKAMLDTTGARQEAYDKMTKTLMFTLRRAKQSFIILAVAIGRLLAPAIKLLTEHTLKASQSLTDFVDKNTPKIQRWAEEARARIIFVKDVLVDFVKYLATDFRSGISFGLELALEEFKVFGKSLLIVMEKIWNDLTGNIAVWGRRAVARKAQYAISYAAAMKEMMPLAQQKRGLLTTTRYSQYSESEIKKFSKEAARKAAAVIEEAQKQRQFEGMYPTKEPISWGAVGEQIKQLQTKAAGKIQKMAPPELVNVYKTAQEKLNNSLTKIAEKYGEKQIKIGKGFWGSFKLINTIAKNTFRNIQDKVAQTVSAFMQESQKTQKAVFVALGKSEVFRPAFVSPTGFPSGPQPSQIKFERLNYEEQRQANKEAYEQTRLLNRIEFNTRKNKYKEQEELY